MPRAVPKPVKRISQVEIDAAIKVLIDAGCSIEGLISVPEDKKLSEVVISKIKFLVEKCGYEKRKKVFVGTHKTTWKRFERTVALLFGTTRVPLSGSNSKHNTNSDSLHPLVYIESKYRKGAFGIFDLFLDTERKAERENKIPVVALKQKSDIGYLLVIRPDDLALLNQIKELSSDTETNLEDFIIEFNKSSNGKRTTKTIRRKGHKG